MSIQTEITLLQNTKDEIRTAIMEKGVTVYNSDPFSIYPTRIGQISTTAGDRDALFTDILERDITSIEIPEGTSRIDEAVFRYCTQMTTVVIPSTVSFIGYLAFEYCTALTSITCLGTTPATLDGGTFKDTNDCPIYVPADSVDTYKTAWPQYASRIQAIHEVKFFRRITDINDVTSGKYLIVDTDNNIALNASLIAETTSTSNGINANNNHISVGNTYVDIEATETTLNAAVDYDGTYLTWTDENSNIYYLSPNNTGTTFDPYAYRSPVIPYINTHDGLTFKASNLKRAIALFKTTTGSKFRWQATTTDSNFDNVALFKLEE